MSDYYEILGSILRDKLGLDDNLFKYTAQKQDRIDRTAQYTVGQYEGKKGIHKNGEQNFESVRVPVPDTLVEDFAVLQVLPGVSLEYCKKSWKHLLKKYHPDFITEESARQEAAAIIRRINRAYKRIAQWFLTGKIQNDDRV